MATPALTRFGSEELKKQFLVPSISGDYVACVAVSEPAAGSDVASVKVKVISCIKPKIYIRNSKASKCVLILMNLSLQTSAVRKGDDLIINGQKMWITNGLKADWICLLANTSEGKPHLNKSLICVPTKTPGITRTKINKIGLNSSDTAQIFFEDVRVPAKNIIGEEGQGFIYQMMQVNLILNLGLRANPKQNWYN